MDDASEAGTSAKLSAGASSWGASTGASTVPCASIGMLGALAASICGSLASLSVDGLELDPAQATRWEHSRTGQHSVTYRRCVIAKPARYQVRENGSFAVKS